MAGRAIRSIGATDVAHYRNRAARRQGFTRAAIAVLSLLGAAIIAAVLWLVALLFSALIDLGGAHFYSGVNSRVDQAPAAQVWQVPKHWQ